MKMTPEYYRDYAKTEKRRNYIKAYNSSEKGIESRRQYRIRKMAQLKPNETEIDRIKRIEAIIAQSEL